MNEDLRYWTRSTGFVFVNFDVNCLTVVNSTLTRVFVSRKSGPLFELDTKRPPYSCLRSASTARCSAVPRRPAAHRSPRSRHATCTETLEVAISYRNTQFHTPIWITGYLSRLIQQPRNDRARWPGKSTWGKVDAEPPEDVISSRHPGRIGRLATPRSSTGLATLTR
jgi:hypothetical protein